MELGAFWPPVTESASGIALKASILLHYTTSVIYISLLIGTCMKQESLLQIIACCKFNWQRFLFSSYNNELFASEYILGLLNYCHRDLINLAWKKND